MNKIDKVLKILFCIIAITYILEFIFVRGLFTVFIMGGLMLIITTVMAIREIVKKNYKAVAFYAIILGIIITEFMLIFTGVIA